MSFRSNWFQHDGVEDAVGQLYINERALRARAGLMLIIPTILLFIRLDHGMHMEMIMDMSTGQMVPREYSHTLPYILLVLAMWEMVMPMSKATARLSLTAQLGTLLTRGQPPTFVPMRPKLMAWSIGWVMAVICLASAIGMDQFSYMHPAPQYLIYICMGFMWLEAVANICAGCILYNALARVGIVKEACATCQWPPVQQQG